MGKREREREKVVKGLTTRHIPLALHVSLILFFVVVGC